MPGRRGKPWYRAGRNAWYCTHERRQVLLASGPKTETAAEAMRAFHALKAQPPGAGGQPASSTTVAELFDRFLASVEASRKASTLRWYVATLKTFRARHRDDRASELRPHHVEAWAITLGESRNYRRNSIAAVKAAFAWGARMGLLESDPVVRTPKPPPERRRAIPSRADVDRLVEATAGTPFGAIVLVLADTGCRLGDAASIEARHVRWDERVAVLDVHKTDRVSGDKVVPLTPRVLKLLRDLSSRHPTGPLLRTTRGNQWRTWAVAHEFVHWRKRLGLSDALTAHGLRHRFVTDAVGVLPRPVVAALLGYSSTEVVDRVYDHSPDEVRESAAVMTAALDAVSRRNTATPQPDASAQQAGVEQTGRPQRGTTAGKPRRRPGRG